MIQLPLAKRFLPYQKKILNAINPLKDVDGLAKDSPFVPATVKAIISIIEEASQKVLLRKPPPVFVVGSKGAVGSALISELKKQHYSVNGFDKRPRADWRDLWGVPSFMSLKADVLVSATGTPGVITAKHVAKGAVVIDVGSPVGDVRFKEVKAKASFVTPVPGGVGPVTIVSLLENTIASAYNTLSQQT
jgi:methylenetetrahydrofolate dehydrogenase (NADP+)/methenyltetrahydrofolate cyclohydrolase